MIRRKHPAPKAFIQRRHSMASDRGNGPEIKVAEDGQEEEDLTLPRRDSGTGPAVFKVSSSPRPNRGSIDELMQQFRHLGPSNKAANPRNTKSTLVKIKPGSASPAAGG